MIVQMAHNWLIWFRHRSDDPARPGRDVRVRHHYGREPVAMAVHAAGGLRPT